MSALRTRLVLACAALVVAAVTGAPVAGAQVRPEPRGAAGGAPEATTAVTWDDFAAQVRTWHPVARQAQLVVEQASAEQRVARGAFDPTLSAEWDRKRLGGVRYFDYGAAKLTLPTPLGPDVTVGWELGDGRFVNPDRRTGANGLLSVGVSLPVGQRLLTDERRTALAVARVLREAAGGERDAALNRLLVQAARDYGGWYEAWRRARIADEGRELAAFRLGAVRQRARAGEVPSIDTVEASLELQRREVQREEAVQALLVARLRAETHLWRAGHEPAALPADAVPAPGLAVGAAPDEATVSGWMVEAARAHPEVRRATGRAAVATAQRRLVAQQRLPALAVRLAALEAAEGGLPADAEAGSAKLGASLSQPLLLLKERGRLDLAGAREEQQELELQRVRRDVVIGVRAAAAAIGALDRQLAAQRVAVTQARQLRDGEQRRFEEGESTLFLVNARERTVLDEEVRLAALEAKRLAAEVELDAARGIGR